MKFEVLHGKFVHFNSSKAQWIVGDIMDNGQFQKISIPYHSHLSGITRAKGVGRGGPLNRKSEGMGGYLL